MTSAAKQQTFPARVWATLSAVDVGENTEKKGNLTYLSWTWAWTQLLQSFPDSSFKTEEPVRYEDGTVECRVTVVVAEDGNEVVRTMWLPVMDNRNNAITAPNARQISDTKMRCLVKCIAMHGLGLNVYAGEDLPVNAAEPEPEPEPEPLPLLPSKTLKTVIDTINEGKITAEASMARLQSKYIVSSDQEHQITEAYTQFIHSQPEGEE